jgi:hypothetical protein
MKAQEVKSFGRVSEVTQLVIYFQTKNASFFQTPSAKDSILFLLNNNPNILETVQRVEIDSQKIVFNRIILSLDLFFSDDEIEGYVYDSVYRTVPFLRKIYMGYMNYPAKNSNSLSSTEGVALMYQSELYLYFCDTKTYLKNINSLFAYIQRLYLKRK